MDLESLPDLQTWRRSLIDLLSVVTVVAAAPLIGLVLLIAAQNPEQWPAALTFTGLYLSVGALAVPRRLAPRVRASALLAAGYAVAALALARGGLAGDGRIYLLILPALAAVLVGGRAGVVAAALSALIYAGFAVAADRGWMAAWLVRADNTLRLDDWIFSGVNLLFCMALVGALYWQVDRFRRQTSDRLRQLLVEAHEARERYRTLSGLTSDFVYTLAVDDGGRLSVEWAGGAYVDVLGYSPEEVDLNRDWGWLVHRDDVERVRAAVRAVLSNETSVEEFRILTKDGRVRWLQNSARPVWDERLGRVVRIHGAAQDITERKETEEALRESERRFRAFTEANLGGVYVLQDGVVRYINPALCRMIGYEREEVVDRLGVDELIHPDDRERIREQIRRRLGEEPTGGRYTLKALRRDGSTLYCEVLAQQIEYEGRPAILGTVLDVTEQVQAQERLERQVAQLALLRDIGGQIISVADLNTVLDRAVHLVARTFGYDHVAVAMVDEERGEVVIGARAGTYRDLLPPGHRLPISQGMVGWVARNGRALLANDVEKEPRYVNCYPDRIPTRSELAVPIRVGGRVVGVLDVQSRRPNAFSDGDMLVLETVADQIAVAIENARLYEALQAELVAKEQALEALRESEDSEQAILNAIDAAVVLLDGDGRILAANRAALSALGEEGERVLGRHYTQVLTGGFPRRGRHLERVLRTGRPVRFEREVEGRVYDHGIYPVVDEQGRVSRAVVLVADVTERVRLQQRAARAERLAALGRLAATIAHEVNNPLQAIQSHLELALDFPLQEGERRRSLEVVRQEVDRLARVVQTVLRVARPTEGEREVVRVEELVERALNLIRSRAERKGIEVRVRGGEDLPPLLVTPGELVQVLLNLLTNAVEAAPEGGWVEVGGSRADGLVELRVVNNGPPIPPEDFPHLFEPFYTTKPDGLGLGLPYSRQVVERYGGTIQVKNLGDGQGVAFTVRLPAVPDEAVAEEG